MLSVMKISWMVQRLMQERLMPRRWTLYAMALSLRWHLVMQRAYVACPMKKTHGHWRVKSSQHRSQKRNTRGFSLVLHIAQDWLTALHALSDSVIYFDNYHDSPAPVHDESQSKYAAQLLLLFVIIPLLSYYCSDGNSPYSWSFSNGLCCEMTTHPYPFTSQENVVPICLLSKVTSCPATLCHLAERPTLLHVPHHFRFTAHRSIDFPEWPQRVRSASNPPCTERFLSLRGLMDEDLRTHLLRTFWRHHLPTSTHLDGMMQTSNPNSYEACSSLSWLSNTGKVVNVMAVSSATSSISTARGHSLVQSASTDYSGPPPLPPPLPPPEWDIDRPDEPPMLWI